MRQGKALRDRFSLQAKIMILLTGLLVACVITISSINYYTGLELRKTMAVAEMRKTASLIATVHSMYREPNWARTEEYMDLIMGLYSSGSEKDLLEVFYILIKDKDGKVRILKVNHKLARKYNINTMTDGGEPVGENLADSSSKIGAFFHSPIPDIDEITMPVIVNGMNRGTIETGYLVVELNENEKNILLFNIAATLLLCMAGIFIAAVMSRRALSPVVSVVKAMKSLEKGSLSVRVKELGARDIRGLTEGFNSMAEGLFTSSRDLDQKTTELGESERKYRSLFQSASDGILLLDGDGVCRDANMAAERIFGVKAGELENTFIFDIIEPSQPGMKFRGSPPRWSGKTCIPGPKSCFVEAHLSSIDERRIIAVIRDVTPWREAEEAVRRARRRQQNMIENLPMGIVIINNNLEITECNKFVKELVWLGVSEGASYEWSKFKIGFPTDFELRVAKVLKSGKDVELHTVKYTRPDGLERFLDIKVNFFQVEPEQISSALIVLDDITEKVKMERIQDDYEKRIRESQKMEVIGSLAGRFAHDFNNTLSVILGNAEYGINEYGNQSPAGSELENIRTAALQGQDLTMRLLSFVRKEKIQESVKDMNLVMEEALKLVESSLPRNISVNRRFSQAPVMVKMDENQLVQALVNVLNNARESMPNGGEISVLTKMVEEDEDSNGNMKNEAFCCARIEDGGKGIKSNLLHKVFDPFFTSKPMGEHTGLGLSTTLGIIETHGGHISISSTDGVGTVVDMYLPVWDAALKSESEERKSEAPQKEGLKEKAGGETVLIVDDNFEMLQIAEKILRKRGFNVIRAKNGEEAVKIFSERKDEVDIIVMDMIMPGISGKKALEEISAIKKGMKALIMSGFSDEDDTIELLKTGIASGYVQKPFRADQLYNTIRDVLDGKVNEGE